MEWVFNASFYGVSGCSCFKNSFCCYAFLFGHKNFALIVTEETDRFSLCAEAEAPVNVLTCCGLELRKGLTSRSLIDIAWQCTVTLKWLRVSYLYPAIHSCFLPQTAETVVQQYQGWANKNQRLSTAHKCTDPHAENTHTSVNHQKVENT